MLVKIVLRSVLVLVLIALLAHGTSGLHVGAADVTRSTALAPVAAAAPADATVVASATSTVAPIPTSTPIPAPAIAISSNAGAAGSLLGVTGTGFRANAVITITIGGQPAPAQNGAPVISNAGGAFAAVVTVPAGLAPGVTIVGASDGFLAAGAAFAVTAAAAAATITVAPTSGAGGSSVVVSGAGFTPNAPISFTIGGAAATLYTGTVATSGADGTFVAVVVVPATVPAGTTTLSASDGVHVATASFVVTGSTTTATLSLSQASGAPGATVTLSAPAGSFPAGAGATVSFQAAGGVAAGLTTGLTNADGSFSETILIPAQAAAGTATISVSAGGITRSATFTVMAQVVAGLSVAPSSVQAGATVQVSGNGFTPGSPINVQIGGQPAVTVDGSAIVADAQGNLSATLAVPVSVAAGTVMVSATDGTHAATATLQVLVSNTPTLLPTAPPLGTPTPLPTAPPIGTPTPLSSAAYTSAPSDTPLPSATPVPVQGITTYFAEGDTARASTTGIAGFTEVLNFLNPGPISAPVSITYYIQGSSVSLTVQRTVPPTSVLREQVNSDVGPDKVVAAAVRAPADVVVTRTILRTAANGARLDGSTSQGVRQPSEHWDFAEGYTGSTFQEYLSLLNPARAAARVTVRLAPQAGSAAGARTTTVTVAGLSRATVNIRTLNKGSHASSVGMIVTSDRPIVAERVEYFGDGAGSAKFGSTVTPGITAPGTRLRFPYAQSGGVSGAGSARQPAGDQAYVTLLNPALTGAAIKATAVVDDKSGHALATTTVSVAAGTRQTIAINTLLGKAGGPYSVTVTASAPLVAEEAQYFGGSPNKGDHPAVALAPSSGGYTVSLSDLDTALAGGTAVQRQLFLYNPGSASIQVIATFYDATGGSEFGSYTVPAGGITTVAVNHDTADLTGVVRGAQLTVAGNSGDVIAYAVGRTTDNRVALGEMGSASS